MLYRLTPPTVVTWCDLSHRTIDLARQHSEVDLERLEWLPSERAFSVDLLRLAVRFGEATSAGLIVGGIHVIELGRGAELRRGQINMDQRQAELRAMPVMQQMERVFPGWTQVGVELDDKVRESTERLAREADEDLEAQLATPVRSDLVEHWKRLGGGYPD